MIDLDAAACRHSDPGLFDPVPGDDRAVRAAAGSVQTVRSVWIASHALLRRLMRKAFGVGSPDTNAIDTCGDVRREQ